MAIFFEYRLVKDKSEVVPVEKGRPALVGCLNTHSFVLALDDYEFHTALLKCDYLLPDGEGVVYALRKWGGEKIQKIAGDDIHRFLLDSIAAKGCGRVYYMGSANDTLKKIQERLGKEYPTIEMRGFSPSYGVQIPDDENARIIDDINAFSPDLLFVGLGAPKQEKWIARHSEELKNVGIIAAIGAVFDFYSGVKRRAPMWMVRMRMEWLYRLLREPRRMWDRVFGSTPRFLRWVRNHKEEMNGLLSDRQTTEN